MGDPEQIDPNAEKNTVTIYMIAAEKETNFQFSATGSLESILSQFTMCFSNKVELAPGEFDINPIQNNTAELIKNMRAFVDAFKAKLPIINQLNEFLKAIVADETFFLIIDQDVSPETRNEIHMYLDSIKRGVDPRVTKARITDLFGDLLLKYDASMFNKDTKKGIGEKDKRNVYVGFVTERARR